MSAIPPSTSATGSASRFGRISTRASGLLCAAAAVAMNTAAADAQLLSIGSQLQLDDLPSTILSTRASISHDLGTFVAVDGEYLHFTGRQQPFMGTPELNASLHGLQAGLALRLLDERIALTVGGGAQAIRSGPILGTFRGALRIGEVLGAIGSDSLRGSLIIDARKELETSVVSAVHERITYGQLAGQLDLSLGTLVSATLRAQRRRYSDANDVDVAYGYLLARPLPTPAVAIGYAYGVATSSRSTWRTTGREFDARTRLFTYQQSYYPYFTPIDERGHSLIGVLQGAPVEGLYLYSQVTVPFASTGKLKYLPASGTTPEPADDEVFYEQSGLLPLQITAAAATSLLAPLELRASASYFSKPYYRSTTIGLHASYRF